jgi:hypothetical protein
VDVSLHGRSRVGDWLEHGSFSMRASAVQLAGDSSGSLYQLGTLGRSNDVSRIEQRLRREPVDILTGGPRMASGSVRGRQHRDGGRAYSISNFHRCFR